MVTMPPDTSVSRPIEYRTSIAFEAPPPHISSALQFCGNNCLTHAAKFGLHTAGMSAPLAVGESRHKACKFQQVRNPKERPISPNDDFRVLAHKVRPLRRD